MGWQPKPRRRMPEAEPDIHVCGGSGALSPAATAELMEFSRYLREKADGRTPATTFDEWRKANADVPATENR